jgi:hypothetical protein
VITPSLGRIVLFTVPPHSNNASDVAPAIITRVWSDTCVNLRVLLDSQSLDWKTSMPLHQTREDLDTAKAKRDDEFRAAGYQDPLPPYYAAYWPPRV